VYTDLQSISLSFKNKYLDVDWYQDKHRTVGEPDTKIFYTMTGIHETAGLVR